MDGSYFSFALLLGPVAIDLSFSSYLRLHLCKQTLVDDFLKHKEMQHKKHFTFFF